MSSEEIIKKMKTNDCVKVFELLDSLPEGIIVPIKQKDFWGRQQFHRYFLVIERFSKEWCIAYEDVPESEITTPERIISVSDIFILDALQQAHKVIKDKGYETF